MEIDDVMFQDMLACWVGNATAEEAERVRVWIGESEERRREFERLSGLYFRLNFANRWGVLDGSEAKKRVLGRLKPRHGRRSLYAWGGAVAACVLLISVFTFTRVGTKPGVTPLNTAELNAGSPRATLVLEDGMKVALTADTSFHMRVGDALVKEDALLGLRYEIPDGTGAEAMTGTGYNELLVPRGGEYMMTLSDGTRVWLNAESVLRFPVVFPGDKREVFVKGEVYFEVKRDTSRPFVVHAAGLETRVLGTSFNVMAYEDELSTEITLVSGKVEVESREGRCVLLPGWQAVMDNTTRQVTRREVNLDAYVSWREGLFDFGEMTLEQLVVKLSRWYDVDFFFVNSGARAKKFTGAVKRSNTLQFTLDFIEKTSDVYFKVDGRMIRVHEK